MRHWVLVLIATGVTGFNDLNVTEQKRVFNHCNTPERIEHIVDVCFDDTHPHRCWMPYFRVCLETWR